ncbi:hypothetical protein GCM10028815_20080 [Mariniluteicoccus flavus]
MRASRALFPDPGLAATALRSTVEGFLTAQGIANRKASGGFRSLNERLSEWRQKGQTHDQVGNLFAAIQWLGNDGTHEDADLTVAAVAQGAAILDEAFHRWFTGPDLDAKATAIINERGPAKTT